MSSGLVAPRREKILIGITGAKRSGKNTLSEGLCKTLKAEDVSFAGPLRKFVAEILGYTAEELEARKEEPVAWLDDVTPRQMMQTVGTEWGRHMIHADLWVRSLLARMPQRAIISDVRFDNEAAAIIANGGVIVRVVRDGTGSGDGHLSERQISDELVAVTVRNDSTPFFLVDRALDGLISIGALR